MQKLLARRRRLGVTWDQLAEQSGVPRTTLLYWDRRLRGKGETIPSEFVEVVVARESGPLEVVLRGGRRILVPVEFDPGHLRRVIEVLESGC
jgi:hypothetical protein